MRIVAKIDIALLKFDFDWKSISVIENAAASEKTIHP